jgi:AcrR family transcriptional regulator
VRQAVKKRSRKRAREFNREEILDTARSMFVNEGYETVTIRRIAAKIGCAPGTIYLHFADKAEIFQSLCEETFSKLTQRLAAIAGDNDDPLESLRRGARAYIAFALDHPEHYALTFVMGKKRSLMGTVGESHPEIFEAGHRCFENLRRIVGRCISENRLRITDVDEVSQVLWTSVHGLVSLLITHSGFPFVEPSRLIERQLDVLIEGIRA